MLFRRKKLLNGVVLPAFLATSVNSGGCVGALSETQVLEDHFEKDGPTVIKDSGKKNSNFYKSEKNFKNKIHKDKKANKTSDFLKEAKNFFSKNGLYLALAGPSGFISPFLIRSLVLSDADNAQSPEIESKHFKRSSNNEENKNSYSEENAKPEQEITKTPSVQNNPESNSSNSSSENIEDKKVKQESEKNIAKNITKEIFTKNKYAIYGVFAFLLVVGFVAVYLVCNKVKNKITIKPGLYNYDPERIAKELQYNIFTEKVIKKGVYLPEYEGGNIYGAESVDFNFCTYEELLFSIYELYTTHKSLKSNVDFKSRIEKLFLLKFPENYEKIKIGINLLLPGTILENSYTRTAPDVLASALEFLSGLSNLKNLSDEVRSWLKHRIAGIELYDGILKKILQNMEKKKNGTVFEFFKSDDAAFLYNQKYNLDQNISPKFLGEILNTLKSEFEIEGKNDKKLPIYNALVDDIIFFILQKKQLTGFLKKNHGEGFSNKLLFKFNNESQSVPLFNPHMSTFFQSKEAVSAKLKRLCEIFPEENEEKENTGQNLMNEGMKENINY